jgi:hypothetical protein
MVARIMEALNGDLAGASRERIAYDAGKQLTLPGFLQRKDVICQLA